ncbi:sf3b1 [Symbiodinium sp. CCMP2456]|nr:sf3b1 [Symbiodinium sp. CCMP2456]
MANTWYFVTDDLIASMNNVTCWPDALSAVKQAIKGGGRKLGLDWSNKKSKPKPALKSAGLLTGREFKLVSVTLLHGLQWCVEHDCVTCSDQSLVIRHFHVLRTPWASIELHRVKLSVSHTAACAPEEQPEDRVTEEPAFAWYAPSCPSTAGVLGQCLRRHMLPGKKLLCVDESAVSMLSNIDTLGILMWVLDGEVPLTPPKRYRVYVFQATRPVGEFVNNVHSLITDFWSASLETLPVPKLECHVTVTLSWLGKIGNDELRNDVIKEQREMRLRELKNAALSHLEDLDVDLESLFEEYSDVFKEDQVDKIHEAVQTAKRRISVATLHNGPVIDGDNAKKLKITRSHDSDMTETVDDDGMNEPEDLQLKSCNQCRWAKHGENWKTKCDWVTYLEVAPAGPWGIGCKICADLYKSETCVTWQDDAVHVAYDMAPAFILSESVSRAF